MTTSPWDYDLTHSEKQDKYGLFFFMFFLLNVHIPLKSFWLSLIFDSFCVSVCFQMTVFDLKHDLIGLKIVKVWNLEPINNLMC